MLTSIDTGPVALALVREANVVGTGAFGFGAAGLAVTLGCVVDPGSLVVTEAGGAVGEVVTGAAVVAVVAGALVAGAVVTGAAVAGALVAAGAVAGAVVAAGSLEGMVGNTNVGAGVS